MSRSVLFDTETTGIEVIHGHRVIEIAALELWNDLPTGKTFYCLLDPERDIPEDAARIHNIRNHDVAGQPHFADVVDEFLAFIADDPLVAHNASFDFMHLNNELRLAGRPLLDEARMIDTLTLARARFPGMPNNLDALCRRFDIDLSERTSHNALLDCKLLAQVYVELTGGRQRGLELPADEAAVLHGVHYDKPETRAAHRVVVHPEERAVHEKFLERIKDSVWSTLDKPQ